MSIESLNRQVLADIEKAKKIWMASESGKKTVRTLCRAFQELNAIRARDGAPQGVCEAYFSQVVDEINDVVVELTGKSAHCHPSLYEKFTKHLEDASKTVEEWPEWKKNILK